LSNTSDLRVTLPKNLPQTLKRLEDAELETLLREVTAEADRRAASRPTKTISALQTVQAGKLQTSSAKRSDAPADLPAGKANLIRASHLAGMKPRAIARMVRLPQSAVNRVLDLPAKSKK
jgi:hypothetical protein